jgi:hypothetical protein
MNFIQIIKYSLTRIQYVSRIIGCVKKKVKFFLRISILLTNFIIIIGESRPSVITLNYYKQNDDIVKNDLGNDNENKVRVY